MQLFSLFHIDSSSPPTPHTLAPSSPHHFLLQTDPNEVTCKKKQNQKVQKVSRRTKRRRKKRRRRTRLWSGELGKDIRKQWQGGGGGRWHFICECFVGFLCFVYEIFGRHGDMLGKRWANRHGGWVVLKEGKKKTGEERVTHREPEHHTTTAS